MKQFLVLSKENLDLASWEVKELLDLKEFNLVDNFMMFDSSFNDLEKDLAYTKKVLELLFKCSKSELIDKLKDFDFSSYYLDSFSMKVDGDDKLSKEYGGIVFDNLESKGLKVKVDLDDASMKLEVYFSGDESFLCLLKHEVKGDFESRKSHKRPYPHPSSLHPKLARCMINMLGEVKVVVDPFCGSGGTMLEAGLKGLKVIGFDLDSIQLKRCYHNLKHYGVNDFSIENRDATEICRMDYFIADLPYGKNTKATDLEELYDKFFEGLFFKKGVIGFPDFVDYHSILDKHNILVVKEFDYYLHKNLKKKIVIIKMKK